MLTPELINETNDENYAEYLDTQKKKNQILAMSDPQKKAKKWRELFPQAEVTSDDWMFGATVW